MTSDAATKSPPILAIRLAAAALTAVVATSLSGVLLSPFAPWWGTRYAWPLIHMGLWPRGFYHVGIGVWAALISLLLTRSPQAPNDAPTAAQAPSKAKRIAAKIGTAALLYLVPVVPMAATLVLFRRPDAYGQGIGGLAEVAADGFSRVLVTLAQGGVLLAAGVMALAVSRAALQQGRLQILLAILAAILLLQLLLLSTLGLPLMGICGSLALLGLALSPWNRAQNRWRSLGLILAAVALSGCAVMNVVSAIKQESNRLRKLGLLQCKPGEQRLGTELAGVSDSFLMSEPNGQGPTLFVLATSPANPDSVTSAVQRALPSCRMSPDQAFNPQEFPIRVISARPLPVDLTVRYAPADPKAKVDLVQLKVKAETAIRAEFLPKPGGWPHIHSDEATRLAQLPNLESMGLKLVDASCSLPSQPGRACNPRDFDVGERGQYPMLARLTVEVAR